MITMTHQSVLHNSPPFYAHQSLLLTASVNRSRGYYLYCADGRRIFDMYLGNGRLFCGHKPFQITKKSKEAIDQGLLGDLPHRYHQQLLQRCERMFGQHRYFCFFPSLSMFISTLRRCPIARIRSMRVVDPAYCHRHSTKAEGDDAQQSCFLAYYRVGLPIPSATILLPLLPTPHFNAAQLVCSKKRLSLSGQMRHVSAFDALGMIEALRELESGTMKRVYSDKRKDIVDPLVQRQHKALHCWRSNGHYLHARLSRTEYAKLHKALLEHNILINPNHRGVTLLPPQIPKKEYLKFVQISGKM